MKEVNNKQRKLFIVGLLTFIILIVGATYAYFQVGTSNLFGTSTITGTADSIGSVILTGSEAELSMSLSAVDMMQGNSNINYYASSEGRTTTPTEVTVGVATVSPNTDTNYYHCTYTLEVSQSYSGDKNMYRIFKGLDQVNSETYTASDNELILIVNGTNYDLNSNTLTKEIPGEFYIKGNQTVNITAGLQLVNRSDKNQTLLAGSGVNLSIGVKSGTFSCTAEEEPAAPTETVQYLTYEGETVSVETAHKVSDYRDLNVYQRTYNNKIYTYANESACTTAIQGSETCSEVIQPYFIKETIRQTTNADEKYIIEEHYDGEVYYDNNNGLYYTFSECQEYEYVDPESEDNYATCVKPEELSEYEVCANIDETIICMKETDWENSETLRSQFETAGLTCAYSNYSSWVGTTKPESGYLSCSDEDPTNGYSSPGEFYCDVNANGSVACGVGRGGSCVVEEGYAGCGD